MMTDKNDPSDRGPRSKFMKAIELLDNIIEKALMSTPKKGQNVSSNLKTIQSHLMAAGKETKGSTRYHGHLLNAISAARSVKDLHGNEEVQGALKDRSAGFSRHVDKLMSMDHDGLGKLANTHRGLQSKSKEVRVVGSKVRNPVVQSSYRYKAIQILKSLMKGRK